MSEEIKEPATVSPEIQEVMRNLVTAIRAVKLYPPNNPIYAQSVRKAFEALSGHLQTAPFFAVGVQKTYFLYEDTPVGKEAQINRGIAQDLFAKRIREFVFLEGLSEEELTAFCQSLALMPEETAMRSGIVSILWESNVTHIRVTEAMLEEVITTDGKERQSPQTEKEPLKIEPSVAGKEFHFMGRTLILGDMVDDPKGFSSQLVEIAQQTLEEGQTVEDRLDELYQEAGRIIRQEDVKEQDALFQGLARSVLAMDSEFRDKFISSRLYAHIDSERLRDQAEETNQQLSEELHEIITGRFSRDWNVRQVASLLKKSSLQEGGKKVAPVPLSEAEVVAISDDTFAIARELNEYTADEMETLRAIGEVGTEADIIEAAVRTLIFLLPMVKDEHRPGPPDKEIGLFSGVVRQLETSLEYLLKNGDYDLATIIVRAFHVPVDPVFRPRLMEAVQKASNRDVINAVVADLRKSQKGTPEYNAAYAYLSILDQEATVVLLEALASEDDRSIRRYLIDIIKELGKSQISSIGQRITDGRWYVVRNVVNILGESRSEEALTYLERVIGHKQSQIRHEVIKGLISIGGKRAAGLLGRFLDDGDFDVRLQALRGIGVIQGAGAEEARIVEAHLQELSLNRKENELTVEGIRSLSKNGDAETEAFLQRYLKLRWWRSRKLQEERRAAAEAAIDAINRRMGNGGRTS